MTEAYGEPSPFSSSLEGQEEQWSTSSRKTLTQGVHSSLSSTFDRFEQTHQIILEKKLIDLYTAQRQGRD
jgi:hypothetical protein